MPTPFPACSAHGKPHPKDTALAGDYDRAWQAGMGAGVGMGVGMPQTEAEKSTLRVAFSGVEDGEEEEMEGVERGVGHELDRQSSDLTDPDLMEEEVDLMDKEVVQGE